MYATKSPRPLQLEQHQDEKSDPGSLTEKVPKSFPLSAGVAHWLAAGQENVHLPVRGFFDYSATCGTAETMKRYNLHVSLMDCTLRIEKSKIYGTTRDSTGWATLQGTVDPATSTWTLKKKDYQLAPNSSLPVLPEWEYNGKFINNGIIGEWHYPGDPPGTAHYRGSFGMWLQRDEDRQGQEIEEQFRLLTDNGRVLTRSMTKSC